MNLSVTYGLGTTTLGVHEGTVNNVKLAFLHNSQIFPVPYPDSGPEATV
jgi:hypothetical protein